jgi:uncharacterized membrane protein
VETSATGRVEAFSDGVFAIAITLLIIEIRIPATHHAGTLGSELLRSWPAYLGYLTSFLTIGVMWINHHDVFTLIDRYDRTMLLLNTVLLLFVAFLPFPTAVLARFIETDGARAAAILYGSTMILIAVAFLAWWRYASSGRRLIAPAVADAAIAGVNRSFNPGIPLYVLSTLLVFVTPWASAAGYLALAVFYALPFAEWRHAARP